MKTTLSLLALSLASLVPHARAAVVSLDVIPPLVVGSPFDVQVQVTNVFDGRTPDDTLLAYGFNVAVGNPAVVSYTGEDAGPLFDDFSFAFGGTPMVAGIADFTLFPLGIGPGDFTGPLVLATLHFQLLSPGASTISVNYDSTDPNQGLIFLDLPFGPITAATTIPEPGTLLLAGLALAALFLGPSRQLLRARLHL